MCPRSYSHLPRLLFGILADALDAAGIPYTPSPAGMFTWLDLRAAFSSGSSGSSADGCSGSNGSSAVPAASAPGTWQDEADLWKHMLDVHKLVLTPGRLLHASNLVGMSLTWLAGSSGTGGGSIEVAAAAAPAAAALWVLALTRSFTARYSDWV